MDYFEILNQSKYFEQIHNSKHFLKKIQNLLELGKIQEFKACEEVCEYGTKSNNLYFLLEGKLAVFIPKNESDLNSQYNILLYQEKCNRLIAKDPSNQQSIELLLKSQQEWQRLNKQFNNDILFDFKKYQINLQDSVNSKENNMQIQSLPIDPLSKYVCSMKKAGEMLPGSCFGEIGAILQKSRTATIIATEPTICLLISFQDYKEVFSKEQIYEINFRVLNLSQIFADKSVGTEVIAHLAAHFNQINPTNCIYRQGDPVQGIYLIQSGYVEIFRQEKNYFNNQISIAIKGKGSLIGLEDYFEFDEKEPLKRDGLNLNQKKNGRQFSAMNKDLSLMVFKIEKKDLDYFLEGYSGFKTFFMHMASSINMEYNDKYNNHLQLKHNLLELRASSPSKIAHLLEKNKEDKVELSLFNMPVSLISEKQRESPIKMCQRKEEDEEKSNGKSDKKNQLTFPQIVFNNNSKIKDFKQIFQSNCLRFKRNSKQNVFSYNNQMNCNDKKDFMVYLASKKQFLQAHLKGNISQNEDSDEENQIICTDIDLISQENQNISSKYLQDIQKHKISIPSQKKDSFHLNTVGNIPQEDKEESLIPSQILKRARFQSMNFDLNKNSLLCGDSSPNKTKNCKLNDNQQNNNFISPQKIREHRKSVDLPDKNRQKLLGVRSNRRESLEVNQFRKSQTILNTSSLISQNTSDKNQNNTEMRSNRRESLEVDQLRNSQTFLNASSVLLSQNTSCVIQNTLPLIDIEQKENNLQKISLMLNKINGSNKSHIINMATKGKDTSFSKLHKEEILQNYKEQTQMISKEETPTTKKNKHIKEGFYHYSHSHSLAPLSQQKVQLSPEMMLKVNSDTIKQALNSDQQITRNQWVTQKERNIRLLSSLQKQHAINIPHVNKQIGQVRSIYSQNNRNHMHINSLGSLSHSQDQKFVKNKSNIHNSVFPSQFNTLETEAKHIKNIKSQCNSLVSQQYKSPLHLTQIFPQKNINSSQLSILSKQTKDSKSYMENILRQRMSFQTQVNLNVSSN